MIITITYISVYAEKTSAYSWWTPSNSDFIRSRLEIRCYPRSPPPSHTRPEPASNRIHVSIHAPYSSKTLRKASLAYRKAEKGADCFRTNLKDHSSSLIPTTRRTFQLGRQCDKGYLERAGYKRYIAHTKPPLSEANCRTRKDWVEKHLNWTREQWLTILWTDET